MTKRSMLGKAELARSPYSLEKKKKRWGWKEAPENWESTVSGKRVETLLLWTLKRDEEGGEIENSFSIFWGIGSDSG